MHLIERLRPYIIVFLLLSLLAACDQDGGDGTPEVEGTADPTPSLAEYAPFEDDGLGLAIEHPANWVTQSSVSGLTVATSQSVIDAQSLGVIGDEAFIVIIPGEIDLFNFQTSQTFDRDNILQALATYKILLEREGQQYVTVHPPEALTDNDQNLARMVLRSEEDGQPLITVMAVVMSDTHMVLVSAASHEDTADEMRPVFYRIIESIEVRPPAGPGGDS